MNWPFFSVCVLIAVLVRAASAEPACSNQMIAASIEVPPRDFTAADLLPSNACPALLAAAARLRLGRAPLEGSMRVFDRNEVHSIFSKVRTMLGDSTGIGLWPNISVPERVVVRRIRTGASSFDAVGRDAKRGAAKSSVRPLVRPGQAAALVWEGHGIRTVVPVICLDRGASGEAVRVRITPSGQVVHAVVVDAGVLRAAS